MHKRRTYLRHRKGWTRNTFKTFNTDRDTAPRRETAIAFILLAIFMALPVAMALAPLFR